jgi:glycine C-acetyltransferase
LKALEIAQARPELRGRLWENTAYFRGRMAELGFDIIPGTHPIVPVMVRDELKNVAMAESMNRRGIFVVSFSFPVVPRGQARIRVQISAAHTREQLDTVLSAFEEAGREQGLI